MNKYLKIALILIGLGLVGGLGIFYWAFNKPHRDVGSEKPEFTLEATTLFKEFQANELECNAKYNDKVIEVSGKLFGVNPSNGTFMLILESETEGVTCALDSAYSAGNAQKILALAPGALVSVKGRCVGLDMIQGVMLDNCTLPE